MILITIGSSFCSILTLIHPLVPRILGLLVQLSKSVVVENFAVEHAKLIQNYLFVYKILIVVIVG
jgi:hypothetical protein